MQKRTARVLASRQKRRDQRTDSLLGEEEDAHALAAGRPSTGIVLPEGQGLENHFFLSHKQQNGGQTMAWLESKLAHRDLSAWYDNAMEVGLTMLYLTSKCVAIHL